VVEEDSPSSSAPPLGDAVTSGLALGLGVPLVDELAVAAPCIVGEAVAYGLAVAVARGLGDAVVGRGEAVVAGEALWVWAKIEGIAALTTASVTANRRDVFTRDKEFAPEIDHRAPKKNRHTFLPQMWKQVTELLKCILSYVDIALARGLPPDNALYPCTREWSSGRLHAAHRGYRAHGEFHARRAATL
jgi:hypothetical protein